MHGCANFFQWAVLILSTHIYVLSILLLLLYLVVCLFCLVGFPAFAEAMRAISSQRVDDLNKLISMPAEGDNGIMTDAMMAATNAQEKKDDPLELRLAELQAGVAHIMHHLRGLSRRG